MIYNEELNNNTTLGDIKLNYSKENTQINNIEKILEYKGIDIIYLENIKKIRKDFIFYINELNNNQSQIKKYKEAILKIQEKIVNNVDKTKSVEYNVNYFKDDLHRLDNYINITYNLINTTIEKIDILKKKTQDIYEKIKSEYPHLSEDDIKEAVYDYLNKHNLI